MEQRWVKWWTPLTRFMIFPYRCHLSLGGYPLAIQTYTWDKTTYGNGKKYIATAYIVSSTQ